MAEHFQLKEAIYFKEKSLTKAYNKEHTMSFQQGLSGLKRSVQEPGRDR